MQPVSRNSQHFLALSVGVYQMIVLIMILHSYNPTTAQSFQEAKFKRQPWGPKLNITFLANDLKLTSSLKCAAYCSAQYSDTCYGYMFDKSTQYCSPLSDVNYSETPQNETLNGSLYLLPNISYCDYYNTSGFNLYTSDDVTKCAAIFHQNLNYHQAKAACIQKGGQLFTGKNNVSMNLLRELYHAQQVSIGYIWVGLNDQETEGVFRWTDGELATWVEWFSTEPNDDSESGEEDCVAFLPGSNGLYDGVCSDVFYYACEIKGFY